MSNNIVLTGYCSQRNWIRRQGDITKRRVLFAREYARYQYRQGTITDVAQGGQYTRVYLCNTPFAQHTQAPKQWHGAPFPAIRRAIGALGCPRIGRIPQDMVLKLQILRDLYYLDEAETEAESKGGKRRPMWTKQEARYPKRQRRHQSRASGMGISGTGA
jgi:hypothetical protein